MFNNKKLLRFRGATSPLEDFAEGTRFKWVIPDNLPADPIKKVVFCSGQVYYDALDARTKRNANDMALIRLE